MTTTAQSGRERLRWDEFLPVRGKWARRLLLLPLWLLLGWAPVGMDVRLDQWSIQTKWIQQLAPPVTAPMLNQPVPDNPYARSNFIPIGDRIFVVGYSWPGGPSSGMEL